MARQVQFIFDGIAIGSGTGKLVFKRDATTMELRNPGSEDILVYCDEALIVERPSVEEILEDEKSGAAVCSQFEAKFVDTFQSGFLKTNARYLGGQVTKDIFRRLDADNAVVDKQIISRRTRYSLLTLLTNSDEENFIRSGITVPTTRLIVEWHTVDKTNPRNRFVVDLYSTSYDEEFIYGETIRGKHLIESRAFYRYDAAEKVVAVVANDLNKDLLDSHRFTGDLQSDLIPPEDIGDPAFQVYLPIVLGDPATSGPEQKAIAYFGFAIHDLVQRMYTRALGEWVNSAENCPWHFHCSEIPTTIWGTHSGNGYEAQVQTFLDDAVDSNDHWVSRNFNIAKNEESCPDVIYMWRGLLSDIPESLYSARPDSKFPYAFFHYPSWWDVLTNLASSLGYWTRYSWKSGKSHVQHLPKVRDLKLLTVPPALISKSEPFHEYDTVQVEPYLDWGTYVAWRRWDNRGHNYISGTFGESGVWTKQAKWVEPALSQTRITVVWNHDLGYFDENVIVDRDKPKYEPMQQPNPEVKAKRAASVKQVYGLFRNFRVGGSGWDNAHHFSPQEFVYVFASTGAEYGSTTSTQTLIDDSGYPGLILWAGDSADKGKTILPNVAPAFPYSPVLTGGAQIVQNGFYRGAGAIEVPYGDKKPDGSYEYVKCFSALEARAVCEMNFKVGNGRSFRQIEVPTVTDYENEYGEVGDTAIYPGLGLTLYGQVHLITRTKIKWESDTVEIDAFSLPQLPPTPTTLDAGNQYEVWWIGDGGDTNKSAGYHNGSNPTSFKSALRYERAATVDVISGDPIAFDGSKASAGAPILGIAEEDTLTGAVVPVIALGIVNVAADGAVSAGDDIEVGSTGYRTRTTGAKIGRALTSAAGGASFMLFLVAASDLEGVTSFNGRTNAVSPASGDYTAAQVTNAVDSTATYANPSWLTALAGSKITGFVAGNLKWAVVFPPTHTSPGTAGDIAYNPATGELAVCYATNQWTKFSGSIAF